MYQTVVGKRLISQFLVRRSSIIKKSGHWHVHMADVGVSSNTLVNNNVLFRNLIPTAFANSMTVRNGVMASD
jgi:hypothetical protein